MVIRAICTSYTILGDNREKDPPVLIPNTEVKLLFADNTWLETARKDRTSPGFNEEHSKECSFFISGESYLQSFSNFVQKQKCFCFPAGNNVCRSRNSTHRPIAKDSIKEHVILRWANLTGNLRISTSWNKESSNECSFLHPKDV